MSDWSYCEAGSHEYAAELGIARDSEFVGVLLTLTIATPVNDEGELYFV